MVQFGQPQVIQILLTQMPFSLVPVFEMKTVDFSKVTIRGEQTNVYIAMNAQGNLHTAVSNII